MLRGQSLRQALNWFSWYWKGRNWKTDPRHRVQLSAGTIKRLFYQWKQGGKTPAAVALRYRSGRAKLPAGQVREMALLCLASESRSFRSAWGKVQNPAATVSAFWHAMPAEVRAELVAICAARRALAIKARRALQMIHKHLMEARSHGEQMSQDQAVAIHKLTAALKAAGNNQARINQIIEDMLNINLSHEAKLNELAAALHLQRQNQATRTLPGGG